MTDRDGSGDGALRREQGGRLVGRRAVVTGGSSNIGAAIARAFAAEGADLVIVARRREPLEAEAARIVETTGAGVQAIVADVGVPTERAALVDRVLASGGAVDVLVNNAYSHASTEGIDILELEDQHWSETLGVNLLAPYALCKSFGQHMRTRSGGSIINVVAGPGRLPLKGYAPYGVTTSALWMLTRYLALECAPDIRVNAICPGTIHPDGEYRTYAREQVLPLVPMARVGRPEEVAGAAVYLASDDASYTTGALITVNGGRDW